MKKNLIRSAILLAFALASLVLAGPTGGGGGGVGG